MWPFVARRPSASCRCAPTRGRDARRRATPLPAGDVAGGPWPPAARGSPGRPCWPAPREERLLSFLCTPTPTSASPCPTSPTAPTCPRGSRPSTSFLRDFRTGDEHPIDPALFDVLNDLRLATGTKSPFQVISAYRSPQTNAAAAGARPGRGAGQPAPAGARHRRAPRRRRLRRRCATPRSSCSAAASATTAAPTSSTSTPAASAAGRSARDGADLPPCPARLGNAVESAPKNPSQGKTPWHSPPAPARAPTRSSRRSAPAAWARSTARATRGSAATWRSRCCPTRFADDADALRAIRAGGAGGRRALATRTSSRSSTSATHEGRRLPRHRAARGRDAARPAAARARSPLRKAVEIARPGRRGPRRRAREGHRPPRPQAREHLPDAATAA